MSLACYQRELALMIASPARRRAVATDANAALMGTKLSERERRRLTAFSRDRGMIVNTALYRANRLSPICNVLPWTCDALGARFSTLVHEYWHGYALQDLQFPNEATRFASYLRTRADGLAATSPLLFSLLALELARYELALLPQRQIRADARPARRRAILHPLVRVVRFQRDPTPILRAATSERATLERLPRRACAVLLDARTTTYSETVIAGDAGRTLEGYRRARPWRAQSADKKNLAEYLVEASSLARASDGRVL
jgi:hypothetical protein